MSRITNLAIIGLLIHVSQGAISTGSFKLMTMPSSIWPPYVTKTVDVPVESRQECASYCMSETTCHGLVMEGDVCWIVDLLNNNNLIGTQTSTRVYIKEGYLQSQMDSTYTLMKDISSHNWHSNIYYQRAISGPATLLDCSNECLNVERTTCEMFVFDNGNCFLGQMGHTAGSLSLTVPTNAITIYGVSSPLALKLVATMSTKNDVPGAKWSSYIYLHDTTATSAESCGGTCLFDKDTPCHFYLYTDDNCYLGNFDTSSPVIPAQTDTKAIEINTETVATYSPSGFFAVSGARHNSFIKYDYTPVVSEAECMMNCILDLVNDCHYIVFIASASKCAIGNLDVTSPVNIGNYGTQASQIYIPNTDANELYFNFAISNQIWPPMIGAMVTSVATFELCARYCTLVDPVCQLFAYRTVEEECAIGSYTTNANVVALTTGFEEIYIRDSHFRSYGPGLYRTSPTSIESSDWVNRIYKVNTVTGPNSLPDGFSECQAMCLYDDEPCLMFAFESPNCYLGSPLYVQNVASSSSSLTFYGRYDAAWGTWGEWSGCSHTCEQNGQARRLRWRTCDNPDPMYGGNDCPDLEYSLTTCTPAPGACGSVRVNSYDLDMNWVCPTSGEGIYRVESHYSTGAKDREYYLTCASINRFGSYGSCSWSGYLNNFDGSFDYICPSGGFIAGMISYHDSGYEDRRFRVYCCTMTRTCRHSCSWSGYVGSWHAYHNYYPSQGYMITGLSGYHDNGYEDRRLRYYNCYVYDCP